MSLIQPAELKYSEKYRKLLPVQDKNGMAKEYQVIQFLMILEEHDAI